MDSTTIFDRRTRPASFAPWAGLAAAVVSQAAVSSLQWTWTLFVEPIDARFHWGKPAIQVTFSILVLTQAFLMPAIGYAVDRWGYRLLMAIGGVLAAVAWIIDASASTLFVLYLGGLVTGVAYGLVCGVASAYALKQFPTRRGLAVGLCSGAFAVGAVFTGIPIANMIRTSGYQATLVQFGLILGGTVLIALPFLGAPPSTAPAARGSRSHATSQTPRQALRSPLFYLLYAMFLMVCTGGLIVAAQLGTLARDFEVATTPVPVLGIGLGALPFALSVSRVMDGVGRLLFGWVSDHIGREPTMVIAFVSEAVGFAGLLLYGHNPAMFIFMAGLVAFGWGEIFALYPALLGDVFGRGFIATIWGLMWTGKGAASLLVPLASWFLVRTGTWTPVLVLAILGNVVAAGLALLVLMPRCVRVRSEIAQEAAVYAR